MSGSIYSASDKAIFDALSHPKVTKSDLQQLFLSRGTITSNKTDRKDLAKYFSSYLHSYSDYQKLAKILGSANRREKQTFTIINTDVDIDTIETALQKVKSRLVDYDATGDITKTSDGLIISVKYKTLDFNKSEFKQVVERKATIEIETDEGKFCIRRPSNSIVDDITTDILSAIEDELDDVEELEIETIDLSHIPDPNERTKFFTDLVNSIDGYDLNDVSDVFVYQPKIVLDNDDEDDDADVDIGVHISKASLKGEGVLMSDELDKLLNKGFYIFKIVWKSIEQGVPDSDIFEFEAQFSDQENFKNFSYLIRGHYKYKGESEYNSSRTQCSSIEERVLSKEIEHSAKTLFDNLPQII